MAGRLEGKVALITGATSGIGEATARLFLAEGARVVVAGRSAERGQALAAELGGGAVFIRTDVTCDADIEGAVQGAVGAFGRLDVLFNNAGAPVRGGPQSLSREDFAAAMDLLLASVLFGIRYAAPVMAAQGRGAIINNASVAAARTHMGGYLYSIAKAGVVQATRMAGMELGPLGITVNSISPGGVATPIFFGGAAAADALSAEHRAAKLGRLEANLSKATPLRRTGRPLDIAHAALFLASDEGAYVNCHDLVVDAGMTAGGRTNFE